MTEDWYIFKLIFKEKRKLIGIATFKATFTEPRIVFNKKVLTFSIDIQPKGEELQQTGRKLYTYPKLF